MTREELEKILNDLGDTSQEVYQNLKDKGIKGFPCRSTSCPVATYLRSILGREASVGANTVGLVSMDDDSCVCSVPAPVKSFIERFDGGYDFQDLHIDKENDPFCKK